jgi:hypothetical protein
MIGEASRPVPRPFASSSCVGRLLSATWSRATTYIANVADQALEGSSDAEKVTD